jgi:hypothetical protein
MERQPATTADWSLAKNYDKLAAKGAAKALLVSGTVTGRVFRHTAPHFHENPAPAIQNS